LALLLVDLRLLGVLAVLDPLQLVANNPAPNSSDRSTNRRPCQGRADGRPDNCSGRSPYSTTHQRAFFTFIQRLRTAGDKSHQ
jgi:hypothetical protein